MNSSELIIQRGLPESDRDCAAQLYDEAFGPKFSVAIKSDQERLTILKSCFDPEFAFVAMHNDGLVGIAGFHTTEGSLTGGMTYKELVSKLGRIKGIWAALIFSLYERKPAPGELLMDGIAVRSDFRGQGIGSKLLDEIAKYASENKYKKVRLDVIDINPRAKKLYEKKGFKAVKTENFPYFRWLLGFSSSTTMQMEV